MMKTDGTPSQQPIDLSTPSFLAGGGEMGALVRAFDWTHSALGAPAQWPQSLKTAIRIMLTSRQPIWIGWGEELLFFYNDPYKAIIGGRHPVALGQPTASVWHEIWHEIGPLLQTAMVGGEGTFVEQKLLIMERNDYPEETYYTFSYSPVPDDHGGTGGIICANSDDTERVLAERQLSLLRDLAATTAEARTLDEVCGLAMQTLAGNPRDVPFALLYLGERDGVLTVVDDLAVRFDSALHPLPGGAWSVASRQAAIVPVLPSGETSRRGVLIVGLNPFRLLGDRYRRFLNLVAGQISGSIGNVQAYEEERRRAEMLAEIDRAKTTFFSKRVGSTKGSSCCRNLTRTMRSRARSGMC